MMFRQICRGLRHSATARPLNTSLGYDVHGAPAEVLRVRDVPCSAVGATDICVQMIAAPVNPSDINQIEGKYPIKPQLPAVAGNEGVGFVTQRGSQVAGIAEGDWVVPLRAGQGTWRQAGTFAAADWHCVPSSLPAHVAATLSVNPVSALRMLHEFVELRPGDTVVQNGANSAVGRAVIQFARAQGIRTVNVVRDRPDLTELAAELTGLGADLVTTEDKFKEDLKTLQGETDLKQPKLALNCVGGSSAAAIANSLGSGATLVTYGGMSMQPVKLPTSLFIFKDLRARGFWLSADDTTEVARASKAQLIDSVVEIIQQGDYKSNVDECSFENVESDLPGFLKAANDASRKQLITFT